MGKASAVLRALQYHLVMKENCWKKHNSQFLSPIFIYGQWTWILGRL